MSVTQGIWQSSYKVIITLKRYSKFMGGIMTWKMLIRKQSQDIIINDMIEGEVSMRTLF